MAFIMTIGSRHRADDPTGQHGAIKNAAGLYGDMQGIIGGQIPEIAGLELNGDSDPPLIEKSNGTPVGEEEIG